MSIEHIRSLVNELDSPSCTTVGDDQAINANSGCFICHERSKNDLVERTGNEMLRFSSVFIVCSMCGNKRCPHAAWHGYQCTSSSEPNQVKVGSPPPEQLLARQGVEFIRELLAELERK